MSGLSPDTKKKVNEWIMWFNYHSDKVSTYPLDKQIIWLLKAVNGSYETMSMIAQDLDNKKSRNDAGLIIPRSWRFELPNSNNR